MNQRLEIASMVLGHIWSKCADKGAPHEMMARSAFQTADALIAEDEKYPPPEPEMVTACIETQDVRVMITAAQYSLIRQIKDVGRARQFLGKNGFLKTGWDA